MGGSAFFIPLPPLKVLERQKVKYLEFQRNIAGRTAEPIELKFVVETHGWPGVLKAKKSSFFSNFFHGQRPGPSASTR